MCSLIAMQLKRYRENSANIPKFSKNIVWFINNFMDFPKVTPIYVIWWIFIRNTNLSQGIMSTYNKLFRGEFSAENFKHNVSEVRWSEVSSLRACSGFTISYPFAVCETVYGYEAVKTPITANERHNSMEENSLRPE